MTEFWPIYLYSGMVIAITLATLGLSGVFSSKTVSKVKYMPYESGMQTETHLLEKRLPVKHYLVALIFLIFDIEVIFLYPWAVVAKQLGAFAFYEMLFFWLVLLVGMAYVWKKKGLEWE